jgi:hypothetical protein
MAAAETIRFGEPAQLCGISFKPTESSLTPSLSPLWRFACCIATGRRPFAVACLHSGEPRP